ncbi:MAG: sialidase family protein [Ignavibacteria bacterium]|jgi:hypothetical protein
MNISKYYKMDPTDSTSVRLERFPSNAVALKTDADGNISDAGQDVYKVKINATDDNPDFLEAKISDVNDIQFKANSDNDKIDSVVYQLTGLGGILIPVNSDFQWSGGGRGIAAGRGYLDGVEYDCWVGQDLDGYLYWTSDEWKTTEYDNSLRQAFGETGWVGLSFVWMSNLSQYAWVAGKVGTNTLYYALHIPANYQLDGTLSTAAWVALPYVSGGGFLPSEAIDMVQTGNTFLWTGSSRYVGKTSDFTTFTEALDGGAIVGAVTTDRNSNVLAICRDSGKLWISADAGATWTTPAYIYVDDAVVTTLPVDLGESWGSSAYGLGVWIAANYNSGVGSVSFCYSYDLIRWYTVRSAVPKSFYSVGFDGVKFFATSVVPNAVPPIYQMLASSIAAKRLLVAERGIAVDGDTYLRDHPGAARLGTDGNGKIMSLPESTPRAWGMYNGLAPQFDLADPAGAPLRTVDGYAHMAIIPATGVVLLTFNVEATVLFRSNDFGDSFSSVTLPSLKIWDRLLVTQSGTVLVFTGAWNRCSRSTDQGATFGPAIVIPDMGAIHYAVQLDSGRIIVTQSGFNCAYSDDDGLTWSAGSLGPFGSICHSSVGDRVVSVDTGGVCKWTTDGVTWNTVAMPSFDGVSEPCDAGGVLLCLNAGGTTFAKSIDGGSTWVSGNSLIGSSTNSWYRMEYVPFCDFALGFYNNATGTDYVMCGTTSKNAFFNVHFPATQNRVQRVIGVPSRGLLFVLTQRLLYRVPVL